MSLLTPFKNFIERFQPKMNAIGINHDARINEEDVFIARQIPKPKPDKDELLVKILATSINPVDIKTRENYRLDGIFKVLGLDAVGEVEAIGRDVAGFTIGEHVYYAGTQTQTGTNAEYQVIKADLVAQAPHSISAEKAAAMPLTSVTAYDIIKQGFNLPVQRNSGKGQTVFIINGAGGVGSILIQLAKYVGLTVIATAGSSQSKAWEESLGADYVIDYHQEIMTQLAAINHPKVEYIANLQDTNAYWDLMLNTIKPFGRIASIVETTGPVDMGPLKDIAAQFTWIFVLARGNYNHNLREQGQILTDVAQLIDEGELTPTVTKIYHGLTVDSIKRATKTVESQHALGKVVVDYQEDGQ